MTWKDAIIHSTTILFDFATFIGTAIALVILRRCYPIVFNHGATVFNAMAKQRRLVVIAAGALAFNGCVLLAAIFELPQPAVHDEFSYLLAGDTFAHGRLTNPAHPQWVSFETLHVNVRPTYHSIYPPAQGAVLAVGQVLTGHPIVGVWLSMAAACSALCWMLQTWLPARWAMLGAMIATMKLVFAPMPAPSLFQPGYWSNSYWGGAVAMLGGALVFGAAKRLVMRPSAGVSLVLGIGCAILANSRPFEGLLAVLTAFGYLAVKLPFSKKWPAKVVICRLILPLAAILGPTVAFMLYYDYATTGHPLQRPYELSSREYAVTPATLLQPLLPQPAYRHDEIRRYHLEVARPQFLKQQSIQGYIAEKGEKAIRVWKFFCGPILCVPLVPMLFSLRSASTRFAAIGLLITIVALLPMSWLQPHYLAPVTGLFIILVTQGVRVVAISPRRHPLLRGIAVPTIVMTLGISTCATLVNFAKADRSSDWCLQRSQLVDQLVSTGEKHLVLVSYVPQHSPHQEWVYNSADLETAPIVWARESDEQQTRYLIAYYPDRVVWRVHVTHTNYILSKCVTVPRK